MVDNTLLGRMIDDLGVVAATEACFNNGIGLDEYVEAFLEAAV